MNTVLFFLFHFFKTKNIYNMFGLRNRQGGNGIIFPGNCIASISQIKEYTHTSPKDKKLDQQIIKNYRVA